MKQRHPMRRRNATQFGYESVGSSPHRKAPYRIIKSEDYELNRNNRKVNSATIRDEHRNAALLAWMVRRHLDYVSRFELSFRTGNDALDAVVISFLAQHRLRQNFDIARRHSRDQWMRIFEGNKSLAGDAGGIMTAIGSMQGIDSEQIALPDDWGIDPDPDLVKLTTPHGLVLGDYSQVEQYCICRFNEHGRRVFDHFEPAENIVFDGYFGTSFNQTRGISPVSAAINDVIDQRDITLLTKVNLKLKNLFGIAIFRDSENSLGDQDRPQTMTPDKVNILDLDVNDKVQSIEAANTPSANAIDFMGVLGRIVLTALDIPYTSYDSSQASFSARIADRAEYEASAESKRTKNADVLREIYHWRIPFEAEQNPQFAAIIRRAKMTPESVADAITPLPACTPWLDRFNELRADALAVALGIESIPRLARKRGLDAYDIGQEQANFLGWAKDQGLPIFYANGGQQAVQKIMDEGPTENAE